MTDVEATAEELVNLTVKEANELATILKDEYGIGPAAVASAITGPATAAAGGATEEKSDFDVVLIDAGANKLKVVKVVKETCSLGLKEAEGLVDGTPSTLEEGMTRVEAENLRAAVETEGAEVELK